MPTIHRVWNWTVVGPRSKPPSVKGGMRAPSAPKKYRPMPTIMKCTATDTISSSSTLASATGWKARRYTCGPSGTTKTSATTTCRT
jgi:hypothetical protein